MKIAQAPAGSLAPPLHAFKSGTCKLRLLTIRCRISSWRSCDKRRKECGHKSHEPTEHIQKCHVSAGASSGFLDTTHRIPACLHESSASSLGAACFLPLAAESEIQLIAFLQALNTPPPPPGLTLPLPPPALTSMQTLVLPLTLWVPTLYMSMRVTTGSPKGLIARSL